MNISNQGMRDYLGLANIYKGDAIKKKTDLIEMIIYRCTINKLEEKRIKDISTSRAAKILKNNEISIKSLPGYGNARLKEKEMKPVEYDSVSSSNSNSNKKPSINVYD